MATRKPKTPVTAGYRTMIVKLFAKTVADQARYGNWRYVAVRPQQIVATYLPAGRTVVEADCSDGGRIICRLAGLPDDPAGNSYADYGNSSSIWAHLTHIPWGEAQPGDPVTFGKWTGEDHVTWLWAKHGPGLLDWDVWNHGEQGQPVRGTLAGEVAGHPGTVATLCQLNVPPAPPPTAADLLRAETGFYAWTAWRISEGPWRGYPLADKAVRPAVPRVISAAWWVRYGKFLAARKKPNS